MKILMSDAFDSTRPGRLAEFGEVTEDRAELASCEVVLIRGKTKATREYLDGAPDLKVIIRGGVGIDNIDLEHARNQGIIVQNTAAASSIAVAELAFALMIALPNHVIEGHEGMVAGKWLKKECKRTELHAKTLGLVGMGLIATEMALRAKAFGMQVLAYRNSGKPSEHAEVVASLGEMLPRCDYVSLHVPKTADTTGMFDKETIAKMKDGAYLINTARGACVVEEDVVAALESGKLAGYGNDVWMSDPPDDTPLRDAPNTVLLPHLGASTTENLLRIGDVIIEHLGAYREGRLESM